MSMGRNNCLMMVAATQCQNQCKELQRVTVAINGGSDIVLE